MPDSTNARWDADQQGWVAGTPPESAGGETPRQLNIPAPVLVFLVVLLVVLAVVAAVGINVGASEESSDSPVESAPADDETDAAEPSAAEPSGEPSEDGCTDDGGGEPCDESESPEPTEVEDPFADQDVESQAPDGYELRAESERFELHIPEGARYEDRGTSEGHFYFLEDARNFVRVIDFEGVHESPEEAMNALEAGLQELPGYQSYEIVAADPDLQPLAVELNYIYEYETSGTQDVFARTLFGGDGGVYAVLVEGELGEEASIQARYWEAANSFCVNGYACS